jgi:hypothetical protein
MKQLNAHRLERREGYASRSILLHKWGFGVRVELWHVFNGFEVREVPFSPYTGKPTNLHVLELSPEPQRNRHYTFEDGANEARVIENVALLVDAYMRVARPFFCLTT